MPSQALLVRSPELIIRLMTEPAQNYQTSQSASVEGLDDIFTVECQGESGVTAVEDVSSQGESEGYPLAEAARKLGIPYTTFYKQVKAGKHRTIKGLSVPPPLPSKDVATNPIAPNNKNSKTKTVIGINNRGC